jgi:hypothetical protein
MNAREIVQHLHLKGISLKLDPKGNLSGWPASKIGRREKELISKHKTASSHC